MTDATTTIFIDTNVLLHFKRINEIDWPAISRSRRCLLLVAPVVLRELDEQKVVNKSSVLRRRAGDVVRQLYEWAAEAGPVQIRGSTLLDFVENDATIDLAAHRLNSRIPDDELIANALQHLQEKGGRVAIAAVDTGIAVKLRSRPIDIIRLPEDLRLPEEPDPRDKELRELRAEVARAKTNKPKLSLRFVDRSTLWKTSPQAISIAKLLNASALQAAYPPVLEPTVDPLASRYDIMELPPEISDQYGKLQQARGYNEKLEAFYQDYTKYRADMERWAEAWGRIHIVRLALFNDGSMTASDIDVDFEFPPSVLLIGSGELPQRPPEPSPPAPLGSMRLFDPMPKIDMRHLHPLVRPDFDGRIYIQKPTSASASLSGLKQGCHLALQEFYVVVASSNESTTIQIKARTTYHEGAPVDDALVIQVEPAPSERAPR